MGFWADTYGGREGFDEYGYYIDRNPRYYDDDSDYHSYDDSDPEHERQFDSCDVDDGTIDYLPFWRAVRLAAGEDLPSIAMPRERQVLLGCSRIMDIYPNSMPTSSHVRDPKTDAIAVEIEANPTEFVVITMVAILRELTPELAALRAACRTLAVVVEQQTPSPKTATPVCSALQAANGGSAALVTTLGYAVQQMASGHVGWCGVTANCLFIIHVVLRECSADHVLNARHWLEAACVSHTGSSLPRDCLARIVQVIRTPLSELLKSGCLDVLRAALTLSQGEDVEDGEEGEEAEEAEEAEDEHEVLVFDLGDEEALGLSTSWLAVEPATVRLVALRCLRCLPIEVLARGSLLKLLVNLSSEVVVQADCTAILARTCTQPRSCACPCTLYRAGLPISATQYLPGTHRAARDSLDDADLDTMATLLVTCCQGLGWWLEVELPTAQSSSNQTASWSSTVSFDVDKLKTAKNLLLAFGRLRQPVPCTLYPGRLRQPSVGASASRLKVCPGSRLKVCDSRLQMCARWLRRRIETSAMHSVHNIPELVWEAIAILPAAMRPLGAHVLSDALADSAADERERAAEEHLEDQEELRHLEDLREMRRQLRESQLEEQRWLEERRLHELRKQEYELRKQEEKERWEADTREYQERLRLGKERWLESRDLALRSCEVCGLQCESVVVKDAHAQTQHQPIELAQARQRAATCRECGREFSSLTARSHHWWSAHESRRYKRTASPYYGKPGYK